MKRLATILTLLSISLVVRTVAAADHQIHRVFDDDGGRVEIVSAGTTIDMDDLSSPGGKVVALFLGSGWRNPGLSEAEGLTLNRLSLQAATRGTLVTAQEEMADLGSGSSLNDLGIQRAISDMLDRGELERPTSGTVYAIFLAPGIRSTVGQSVAGRDYQAYRSCVHFDQGAVSYIVISND